MKSGIYLTLVVIAIVEAAHSTAVSVYRGSTVTFNCSLSLPLSDALFWHHEQQNSQRTIGIDDEKKGAYASEMRYSLATVNNITTLSIYGVTLEDEGTFRCSSFLGVGMDQWSLEVYVLPTKPTIHQRAAIMEGQLYIAECLVDGGKPAPTFAWQITDLNGDQIDLTYASRETFPSLSNDGTGKSLSKLGVILTRRMQGGRIFCHAYQPDLEEYYSEEVEEIIDQGLFSPFSPRLRAPNETMGQGQNYTFECLVNGANPAANITWSLILSSGEEQVVDGSAQKQYNGSAQFLTNSQIDLEASIDLDQSELRCSASNSIPDIKGEVVFSTSIRLQVNYAPVVEITNQRGISVTSLNIMEGQELKLYCRVVIAKPEATENTWMFKFNKVDSNNRYLIETSSTNESSLTVVRASRSDEGLWQCAGVNSVGAGLSQQVYVHVLYKPLCRLGEQTKYTGWPGEPVDMVCRVEAKPGHVVFTWRRSGVELNWPTETRNVGAYISESTLQIVPRGKSDYGSYECYAENSQGALNSPCVLDLALPGPAESPQDCQVWAVSLSSLSVTCQEKPGSATLTTYTLKVLKDGRYVPLINNTAPNFNVTSLSENLNYSFTVCAFNYEYWMAETCTPPFLGTTAKLYVLPGDDSLTSPLPNVKGISPEIVYIIIAIGCGLGVCVAVAATSIACHMSRNRKSRRAGGNMRDEALQF